MVRRWPPSPGRVSVRDGSLERMARLIEVRLSPACETKEDGFRSASPEVEGGWRAQLEGGVGAGGRGRSHQR